MIKKIIAALLGSFTERPDLYRDGPRSPEVSALQRKLGIPVDGIFGPQTQEAVRNYQRQHGLAVDGIVGPETRAALDKEK